AQLAPGRLPVADGAGESRQVDPVIDDADARLGNALVVDQGLAYRLADADDAVAPLQQQPVEEDALAARVVGLMPAVFHEQDGRPAVEEAGRQAVEEGRV